MKSQDLLGALSVINKINVTPTMIYELLAKRVNPRTKRPYTKKGICWAFRKDNELPSYVIEHLAEVLNLPASAFYGANIVAMECNNVILERQLSELEKACATFKTRFLKMKERSDANVQTFMMMDNNVLF